MEEHQSGHRASCTRCPNPGDELRSSVTTRTMLAGGETRGAPPLHRRRGYGVECQPIVPNGRPVGDADACEIGTSTRSGGTGRTRRITEGEMANPRRFQTLLAFMTAGLLVLTACAPAANQPAAPGET